MAQTPQPQAAVTPAPSTRELVEIVKREFPDLTKFLGSKVGKTLKVRGGEKPGTYVFYERTTGTDIGTCTYDQTSGIKTYTGHFPNTKLSVRDGVKTVNGETVPDYIEIDFGEGNPVTLRYNQKYEDPQTEQIYERREDVFPQLPFP